MPISTYLSDLRAKVGHTTLLVPSVTALIFDSKRRLLLLRHSNRGEWVAPGGSLDPGEVPADAVVREVWEETGLEVEPVRLTAVYGGPAFEVQYQNGDRVSYVMSVFECIVQGGSLQPDGEEIFDAGYFSAQEVMDLPLSQWAKVVLPAAFVGAAQAHFQPARWKAPSP